MKTTKNIVAVCIGILLAAAGLFLLKAEPQNREMSLPYICIGVGCGVFGYGAGELLAQCALRKDPQLLRQIEVEKNDERNLAISARAKGKAFDFMTFLFSALMLVFALMGVDMRAVLLLVFAYLLVQGMSVYYLLRYQKEM